jgi:hypothetical protein
MEERMKNEKFEGVFIKELSGKQLIEYYEYIQKLGEMTPSKSLELACMLISMAVCDKDGNPVYTVESAKDLPFTQISRLSAKVIDVSEMGATDNLKNVKKNSSSTG